MSLWRASLHALSVCQHTLPLSLQESTQHNVDMTPVIANGVVFVSSGQSMLALAGATSHA